MASDPRRKLDIDYTKILAQKLQGVPAWKDMAGACNEILGMEVDERRRRLEKIRDSVKYRRGDTLVNIKYLPEDDKTAIIEATREAIDIPAGTKIKQAKVRNVVKNIAYFQNSNSKDYLDLEFEYNKQTIRWLKPIDIPQERDALLKNSYIMGFDFFNNKLSDEDLQRLYETIQMYWPESGSDDNFMKYIGFIKNTRFDLIPLWSYESEEDRYPVLTQKPSDVKTVFEGGEWYLTSHVEIRYDLAQFDSFYAPNLDDLETLFYYFAPIILVLERIVGSLEIESTHAVLSVNDLTSFEYDINKEDYNTPHVEGSLLANINTHVNYADLNGINYAQDLNVNNVLVVDAVHYFHKIYDYVTSDILYIMYSYTVVAPTLYNWCKYDMFNYNNMLYSEDEFMVIHAGVCVFIASNDYAICKTSL